MKTGSILDRLFPTKYDFFNMLHAQAEINAQCVNSLLEWLKDDSEEECKRIVQFSEQADEVRKKLEVNLVEAFATPFDRGDIYSISISMHKVVEYAKSTLFSIQTYHIMPDEIVLTMAEELKKGTELFSDAVRLLNRDIVASEQNIFPLRATHVAIEALYRKGMSMVFQKNDPIEAIKQREIYHHIKDASSNQEDSVDILHRIIVRLT
jgi:uncharacterized protein Yka (UPF0111/DUF47 family)